MEELLQKAGLTCTYFELNLKQPQAKRTVKSGGPCSEGSVKIGRAHRLGPWAADERKWCGDDGSGDTGSNMVQELIAGQLAKAIFGWTDTRTSGLLLDEQVGLRDRISAR